jgi:group I intron endonuclease
MSYTHERVCSGNIYLQVFPNRKLYAGQTINLYNRMKAYKRHEGSNKHHTNALKLYGFDNVHIISQKVPRYLMDSIEIFLISFYNLTESIYGYNKTTGGRSNGYKLSKETRKLLRLAHLGKSLSKTHSLNISTALTGRTLTPEHSAKISKAKKGKKLSAEACANMSISRSGGKSILAKPVCAFGKVYARGKYASEDLMKTFEQNTKTFISKWIFRKKYPNDIFIISKNFYSYVMDNDIQNITKELYENWC